MKRLLSVLLALGLTGCWEGENLSTSVKNNSEVICMNGVQYYFGSEPYMAWMAPRYNQDGSIALCSF